MSMRRARLVVCDIPALLDALRRLRPSTLIVDIEPLVVPWDSSAAHFPDAARVVSEAIYEAIPATAGVVFATNSRRFRGASSGPGIWVAAGAHKPWRTRYLRDRPHPLAVLGDQVLTDGLLAWRLGAPFIHWQAFGPVPPWPRFQRSLGRLLMPLLFKDDDGTAS